MAEGIAIFEINEYLLRLYFSICIIEQSINTQTFDQYFRDESLELTIFTFLRYILLEMVNVKITI